MAVTTLLRRAEHQALGAVTLNGTVIDLGGDIRAEYRSLIKGKHQFTTVNLDEKTKPDIFHDLEEVLPVADGSYDHAVLMNVLEHVFNYRQLLSEAARVARPGGSVIIVVPFLFPIHPSPHDFWRFSHEALRRECEAMGLIVEKIEPLGSGVFAARYLLLDRLMPFPIRLIGSYTFLPLAVCADRLFFAVARMLKKAYDPADYALGYFLSAKVLD